MPMGGEGALGGAGWILLRSGYFLEGYIMPKTKKNEKKKKKRVKILEAGITLPLSCAQQKELLGWGLSGNEYDFYHNFIQEMGIVHNANFIDHKTMMDLR